MRQRNRVDHANVAVPEGTLLHQALSDHVLCPVYAYIVLSRAVPVAPSNACAISQRKRRIAANYSECASRAGEPAESLFHVP